MTGVTDQVRRDIDLDNFTVNLRDLPFSFWKRLGEATSKCEHIGRAPLLPGTWKHVQIVYLVKGVHSTTAIEGNTLSEDEVMAIFKRESTLPDSRLYLGQEVDNVISAMNEAWQMPLRGDITSDEICRMNLRVLSGLDVADHVAPGQYRTESVGVGGYRCPPPADVPRHMDNFVRWYNSFPAHIEGLDGFSVAILKAIAVHIYFVLVHPFGDGNGRTARLIEWRTLDHAGIAAVATHLLSNHYNLTRTRYYDMLRRASLGNDSKPFFCYALEGLVEQLALQLRFFHDQYSNLVFLDMVRERTPGVSRDVLRRRQELALAIRRAEKPVPKEKIPSLNPILAADYAVKQQKTLTRDLSALKQAGLLKTERSGWTAITDTMYWRHIRSMELLR
jgi:Fic family protein